MSSFKIERNWLGSAGESVSDATMSRIKITVGNQNVTAFRGESERPSENLEIPSYYLAEWIAENWWPLLWEPRKSDDVGDSRDFLARHSALTAQHGFALPRLMFVPFGEQVTVSAKARNVQFADVRFFNTGTATLSRRAVEGELRKFVAGVVERLEKNGIHDTSLQEEWELIEGTEEDEAKFCRLMGALGLSPYVQNDVIASLLEKADEMYGGDALMDLCLTSSPENFRVTMDLAEKATELTASVPAATLEPLASTPVPADHLTVPGYRRGINAARAVRSALGIKDTDPAGSQKLFDKLHIDTSRRSVAKDAELPPDEAMPSADAGEAENAPIVGAVATEDARPKIALLQKGAPQRRFTAARGAFLAWTSDKRGSTSRLMTTAVTRDQQASRAFAAEIMVPISYLRKYSKKSRLSSEDIFEIAANLGASPDLVRKQAQNNGIEPSY